MQPYRVGQTCRTGRTPKHAKTSKVQNNMARLFFFSPHQKRSLAGRKKRKALHPSGQHLWFTVSMATVLYPRPNPVWHIQPFITPSPPPYSVRYYSPHVSESSEKTVREETANIVSTPVSQPRVKNYPRYYQQRQRGIGRMK